MRSAGTNCPYCPGVAFFGAMGHLMRHINEVHLKITRHMRVQQ